VAAAPGVVVDMSSSAIVSTDTTLRVVGLDVRGGIAVTAFVVSGGGTVVIQRSTVGNGLSRAFIATPGARVVAQQSVFTGNNAGAFLVSTDDFVIENVVIAQNVGETAALFDGGALPTSRFAHNTIALNDAVGVECPDTMLIAQSIVHSNAGQIAGTCDVAESIVQGGRAGFANQNVDPQFVNAIAGDFHISATSPAKDVSVISVQPLDVEGRARDAFPDVGAFEAP
jgi:hypothetical protein